MGGLLVIPAIDIKGGRCVRLRQGRMEEETVYAERPEEVARGWKQQGAEWIHVVDLDGAMEGKSVNGEVVKGIVEAVDLPIQLGGGIRSLEAIEGWLSLGVARVVLGTVACERPSLVKEAVESFGERVAVGLDVKDGVVMVKGWKESSGRGAVEVAKEMEEMGVSLIIYTDVSRDGMQRGIDVEGVKELAQSIHVPLVVSGGVASLEDIQNLKDLTPLGVRGVIVGRALYEGRFHLKDAVRVAQG